MSSCPHDPFKKARQEKGVLDTSFQDEPTPMILRYQDVRDAAKDHTTYSSDTPFRVPIPSEENVRNVRQLPIETDPPEHTEYRAIVDPFFRRAFEADYKQQMEALVRRMVHEACQKEQLEIVRSFALPLQSRALTLLLNIPESEAETWISWGTHVFRDGDDGVAKGSVLDQYIHEQFDRAEANSGDDFFSALTQAQFRGRKLTRDEMAGFANLTFAGGRDTIINTLTVIIAYCAEHPEALPQLRANPKWIHTATEEFVRWITPLTHIGRTCPVAHDIHGVKVDAGQRISLNWASANYDETRFEAPEELRLDRKPNPHIGFGFGPHVCLGAPHARLLIRCLLKVLSEDIQSITLHDKREALEVEQDYQRQVGYESLHATLTPQ